MWSEYLETILACGWESFSHHSELGSTCSTMSHSHTPRASHDELEDEKHRHADHLEEYSNVTTIDNIQVLGLAQDDAEFYRSVTPEQKKAVLRKVRATPLLTTTT